MRRDTDRDSHEHSYRNADEHSYGDTYANGDSDPYADTDWDAYLNSYADCDTDAYPKSNRVSTTIFNPAPQPYVSGADLAAYISSNIARGQGSWRYWWYGY